MFASHKQFVQSLGIVENGSYYRRLRTTIADTNILHIQQFLEGNRHLTVFEGPNEFVIRYGSTFLIITDELGFRKVCLRWVPRLLTPRRDLNPLQVLSVS